MAKVSMKSLKLLPIVIVAIVGAGVVWLYRAMLEKNSSLSLLPFALGTLAAGVGAFFFKPARSFSVPLLAAGGVLTGASLASKTDLFGGLSGSNDVVKRLREGDHRGQGNPALVESRSGMNNPVDVFSRGGGMNNPVQVRSMSAIGSDGRSRSGRTRW